MKNCLFIILALFCNLSYCQNFSYKSKEYDLKIFNYILNKTESDSISLEEFIEFSKPFSKWDVRPLKTDKVWAMDTVYSASTIPNFIFGGFAHKYNLTITQAKNKPNQFLKIGVNNKNKNSDFFAKNSSKFDKLSKKILQSSNYIFLNQKTILRIDNTYKENEIYWKYEIPEDSPFPLSNEIKILTTENFTKKQKEILELLDQLKIYSAFKSEKGIYFLIDGFTDNSYGYFYNREGIMEKNNNLFEIMDYMKLNSQFFYYVAN